MDSDTSCLDYEFDDIEDWSKNWADHVNNIRNMNFGEFLKKQDCIWQRMSLNPSTNYDYKASCPLSFEVNEFSARNMVSKYYQENTWFCLVLENSMCENKIHMLMVTINNKLVNKLV